MRKLTTLFIASLFIYLGSNFTANAQVNFFEGTWEEANAAAAEANKPIFLKAYTDWCYWCKVMDKETLTDEAVYSFINENFIAYKADFEKGQGIDLAMKYRVNGFPTLLYFDASGKLMDKSMGYDPDNEAFVAELTKLVSDNGPAYRYPFSTDLAVDFPEFYTQMYGPRKERKKPADEDVIAYLEKQDDLYSEVSWSVMSRFSLNEKYEQHILTNKGQYEELFGKAEVKSKIEGIVFAHIQDAAEENDEAGLEKAMQIVDTHFGESAAGARRNYTIYYYQKVGDWTKFSAAVDDLIAKKEDLAPSRINGYSWAIYEDCDDQAVLNKALGWMVPVVEKEPNYAHLDTYAALLFKTGDLEEAKVWAEKAIAAAKANDEKHEETDALLEKIKEAQSN